MRASTAIQRSNALGILMQEIDICCTKYAYILYRYTCTGYMRRRTRGVTRVIKGTTCDPHRHPTEAAAVAATSEGISRLVGQTVIRGFKSSGSSAMTLASKTVHCIFLPTLRLFLFFTFFVSLYLCENTGLAKRKLRNIYIRHQTRNSLAL